MKYLRILAIETLQNVRNASKLYKKKSAKSKTSLAPKFMDTAKLWVKSLQAEKKARYEKLDELIKTKTNWQTIEERGLCKGNLVMTDKYLDVTSGQIAVFSGGQLETSKWLKSGTPVTLNTLNKEEHLKAVCEGHIVDCSRGLLKICLYNNNNNEKENDAFATSNYIVVPSTSNGATEYLIQLLKNPATLSSDSVHLVNLAYRSIPMRSIHDRKIKSLPSTLNESQQFAVSAALNTDRNLLCIQGPPGTGKTHVIAEIVHQLALRKKRVLICAPTHVAVRNALEATARRMGKEMDAEKVEKQLSLLNNSKGEMRKHPKTEKLAELGRQMAGTPQDSNSYRELASAHYNLRLSIFKDIYKPKRAVFTTLATSLVQKLPEYNWNADVILVDEAAQCTEPATWIAVLTTPSCKKLVLVGDQKQLPAVVLSDKAIENELNVSLMEKLANEFATSNINILLKEQFRMNEKIMNWSNEVFYDNQLTANETVKDITLHDICPNLKHNHVLNSPIFMINMDGEKERTREKLEDYSFTNKDEAQVVSDYVLRLIVDLGLDAKQIAVIAPYYAQIEELRRSIRFPVDVNTVDAFQGHEREVVIFCLVRDNNEGQIGFLRETRRLNVAITRAKRQFVLIGSANMMKRDKFLKKLYAHLAAEKKIFSPSILKSSEDVGLPRSNRH